MDSASSGTLNTLDLGQDDIELSNAAISMISSISPHFTKDIFKRTKIQNSQLGIKTQKASQFAPIQVDGSNLQIRKVESEINSSYDLDEVIGDNEQFNLKLQKVNIAPNIGNLKKEQNNYNNHVLHNHELRSLNAHPLNHGYSFSTLHCQNNMINEIDQLNWQSHKIITDTPTNNADCLSYLSTSPKEAFMNLRRPRDKRIESIKNNNSSIMRKISDNFLENEEDNLERKNNLHTPNDFENNITKEPNQMLNNFTNDFNLASDILYSSQKIQEVNDKSQNSLLEENAILNNLPEEKDDNAEQKQKDDNIEQRFVQQQDQNDQDIISLSCMASSSAIEIGGMENSLNYNMYEKATFQKQWSPKKKGKVFNFRNNRIDQINEEEQESTPKNDNKRESKKERKRQNSMTSIQAIPKRNSRNRNNQGSRIFFPHMRGSTNEKKSKQLKAHLMSQVHKNINLIYDENCLFAYNFDKMREFEFYFPEFNYSKIIPKYNSRRKQNKGFKMMVSKKRNQVRKKLAIFNKLQM